MYGLTDFDISQYVEVTTGRTRAATSGLLRTQACKTSTFQSSYCVRIVKLWNYVCTSAPSYCYVTVSSFKSYLRKTYIHLTIVLPTLLTYLVHTHLSRLNKYLTFLSLSFHSLCLFILLVFSSNLPCLCFLSLFLVFVSCLCFLSLFLVFVSCLCFLSSGEHLAWNIVSFVFRHFWHFPRLLVQCNCPFKLCKYSVFYVPN